MDKKELKKVLEEEKNMKKSRKRSRSPSSEDERPRKKEYGLVVSLSIWVSIRKFGISKLNLY
jgi:hypothetical protein